MKQYLELVKDVLENGRYKMDRTGTGCRSVFGRQVRYDLSNGFPLMTTKKVHLPSIIHELLWFLKGSDNTAYLKENGVKIWDAWALTNPPIHYRNHVGMDPIVEEGYLGPVYGVQWRNWLYYTQYFFCPHRLAFPEKKFTKDHVLVPMPEDVPPDGEVNWIFQYLAKKGVDLSGGNLLMFQQFKRDPDHQAYEGYTVLVKSAVDQISELIQNLKKNPFSRRHVITAWNPADMPVEGRSHRENVLDHKQALPPCHTVFQFYVEEMTTHERSIASDPLCMGSYESFGRDEKTHVNESWKILHSKVTEDFDVRIYEVPNSGTDGVCGKHGYFHDLKNVEPDDYLAQNEFYDLLGVPRLRLSCQLYQR